MMVLGCVKGFFTEVSFVHKIAVSVSHTHDVSLLICDLVWFMKKYIFL